MELFESINNEFLVSTDKSKLELAEIHRFLSEESYWAENIPMETVQRSIDHSYCFGLYLMLPEDKTELAGFARVITDYATFAYLADVFIVKKFRGKGLSKWLMQEIMNNPELKGLRRWMLATRDAHGLYEQFNFTRVNDPARLMQLLDPDIYKINSASPENP